MSIYISSLLSKSSLTWSSNSVAPYRLAANPRVVINIRNVPYADKYIAGLKPSSLSEREKCCHTYHKFPRSDK